MHLPTLNALRMFDAAARRLNFARAAEELNLTQGAVAQQVRRLEVDLGRKLFIRRARGLELTEDGRVYAADIRRAMAIIEDATRSLGAEPQTLTISVPPSFATKVLVPNLPAFSKAHPDLQVKIQASEAITRFAADAVDLAVRQGAPPFGAGLTATQLCPLGLRALCSPDYARNKPKLIMGPALQNHQLIHDGHAHWDSVLQMAGVREEAQGLRFNQTALALDAAANGQGVVLAPAILAQNDIASGRLVEVWRSDEVSAEGYYLIHPDPATTAVKAMMAWLKSLVTSFDGSAPATEKPAEGKAREV